MTVFDDRRRLYPGFMKNDKTFFTEKQRWQGGFFCREKAKEPSFSSRYFSCNHL
jgi:hypothetical protein